MPKLLDIYLWWNYANIHSTYEIVPINDVARITVHIQGRWTKMPIMMTRDDDDTTVGLHILIRLRGKSVKNRMWSTLRSTNCLVHQNQVPSEPGLISLETDFRSAHKGFQSYLEQFKICYKRTFGHKRAGLRLYVNNNNPQSPVIYSFRIYVR